MPVLERSELQASPLADLHAIADQIGLDGFRRLRKADLIDAILGGSGDGENGEDAQEGETAQEAEAERESARPRRRRAPRLRRAKADEESGEEQEETPTPSEEGDVGKRRARASREEEAGGEPDARASDEEETGEEDAEQDEEDADREPARGRAGGSERTRSRGARGGRGRAGRGSARAAREEEEEEEDGEPERDGAREAREASGVVEVLGNGSAFLRVDPPEPSDEDVYISAAQVRRCELVSGDRVTGPVRTPRRSERYPSLVRVDTINGASADSVSDGSRYEDLPVAWPSERIALGSKDKTLEAIEWLTPLGKGSRAVIVGPPHAGKSETLRALAQALASREDLELSLVLAGVRPEEVAAWQEGPVAPAAALTFTASADAQAQALERALDAAKRIAARGADALVLIDGLDGLQPQAARRALAAARNLRDGGSLTVIATASRVLGGETTVIALDAALTSTGRQPILDLAGSGTLKPELLVGEDGAREITKARAAAL